MKTKKIVYVPDDYNQYNVLKVPAFLIIAILYLLKYLFLILLPQLPMVGKDLGYISEFMRVDGLLVLSSLPAALVFIAILKRIPEAGNLIHMIWKQGKFLLLASVLLDLTILLTYVLMDRRAMDEVLVITVYFNLLLAAYLFRSQRIHDLFSEFPEQPSKI